MDCLLQDERITDCKVICEYKLEGIFADITIQYGDNELSFEYTVNDSDGDE